MSQDPDFSPSRRPRFDPTVNLGHVLTMVMMGAALLTMWTNMRVTQADQDSRLRVVERAQAQNESAILKMADNAEKTIRTQDRLALTLEYLAKQIPVKP